MDAINKVVFLLDVDNTLLDNDRMVVDLSHLLTQTLGAESCKLYWQIYEVLRSETGYADYLGALQRYRLRTTHNPDLWKVSSFLLDYPFADRLYPDTLLVLQHLRTWGNTVILSDGDIVFQPRKIHLSGLWEAVEGRILIYLHKEQMLEDVQQRYPAQHYVMVDDKLRILSAMKKIMQHRLTTVFPRQGHYAHDPAIIAAYPPADLSVERIGDLLDVDMGEVLWRH